MGKADVVIALAQQLAEATPGFFEVKGPGVGDKATGAFMSQLREKVQQSVGTDCSEKRICGSNNLAVDFFFPEEKTVVEVALSLRNPGSEFERDILKALMAKEYGYPVNRLIFVAKPGASHRHAQPSTKAIISWAQEKHDLSIEIHELRNGRAL